VPLVVRWAREAGLQVSLDLIYGTPGESQGDWRRSLDAALATAGFEWYEISNWSRSLETRSRHNLAYWRGADWWGAGPGAHSHVGGVRWWNVKHPRAYADRIETGASPALAREVLSAETRRTERVLLETRIAEGLPIPVLAPEERRAIPGLIADGLIDGRLAIAGPAGPAGFGDGRVVPTLRGRLLADTVVHRLLS
jgi:oxygen-independent coproporphyrinogen-3 oxidase